MVAAQTENFVVRPQYFGHKSGKLQQLLNEKGCTKSPRFLDNSI